SAPRITVLSRSAVEESRQQNPDRASFVRALDASYLVTGSVHAVSDHLRVTLNLERPDASVAWGDTVEGPLTNLFDLQKRIATLLGDAIADQTPAGERAEPAAAITDSGPAQLAYWKGRALLDRRDLTGNVQAALTELDTALKADPEFAIAHAALAEAQWQMYLQTNDKSWAQRAMDSTKRALQLEPDRPSVRYTAALTLFRGAQYGEARDEVERALALQPTYEDAIRLRARILMQQGDVDGGLAEFRKVMALRPNAVAVYSDMAVALYNASRFEAALEALEKAIALSPASAINLTRAGATAQQLGDTKKALEYYERANAIQPRADTFSNMGTIYYGLGDYAKAAAAYEGSLLIRPTSAVTNRNLGDAFMRMGRAREAREAYRRAVMQAEAEVSISPSDARAIARLAVYQAKAGDDAGSMRSIRRALTLAPRDAQVIQREAIVHAIAERSDQALRAIERAMANGLPSRAIADEEDFTKLRSLPQFAAIIATPAEVKR
ncbi:MAG TPA: tetratricopeptide repeat protein, partial [Vicinamibacterales bacterium]